MELDDFIQRISEFGKLTPAEKISYFGYYLIEIEKKENFTATDIKNCFQQLKVVQYSNISAYLASQVKKIFIKERKGYVLERSVSEKIANEIGDKRIIAPSNSLFPLSLLDNTRTYIKNMAIQAVQCYDYGLYDASAVMIRKLIETLIIELFERYSLSDNIKDSRTGNFYYLSDLISCLLSEKTAWNISRNATKSLPPIKEAGDLSAHNRRYNATKPDVDKLTGGLRIVIEELVHLIDYPTWNKIKK